MELLKLTKPFVDVRGLLARIVMGILGCLGRTIIGPETKIVSLHTCHIRKDNMAPQGHSQQCHEGCKPNLHPRSFEAFTNQDWWSFPHRSLGADLHEFAHPRIASVTELLIHAEGIVTQRLSKMYRTTSKVLRRPMRNRDCEYAPGHSQCAHATHRDPAIHRHRVGPL